MYLKNKKPRYCVATDVSHALDGLVVGDANPFTGRRLSTKTLLEWRKKVANQKDRGKIKIKMATYIFFERERSVGRYLRKAAQMGLMGDPDRLRRLGLIPYEDFK